MIITDPDDPDVQKHIDEMTAKLAAAEAALATVTVDNARLREALGMDSPWPVDSILKTLSDAAEHLLTHHDCDCIGHEGRRYAVQAADAMWSSIRAALSPAAPAPARDYRAAAIELREALLGFAHEGVAKVLADTAWLDGESPAPKEDA